MPERCGKGYQRAQDENEAPAVDFGQRDEDEICVTGDEDKRASLEKQSACEFMLQVFDIDRTSKAIAEASFLNCASNTGVNGATDRAEMTLVRMKEAWQATMVHFQKGVQFYCQL